MFTDFKMVWMGPAGGTSRVQDFNIQYSLIVNCESVLQMMHKRKMMLLIFIACGCLTIMHQLRTDEETQTRIMIAIKNTIAQTEKMAGNIAAQNRLQCARFEPSDARATLNLVSIFTSNSTFYFKQAVLLNRSVEKFMPEIHFNMLATSDVDPKLIDDLSHNIKVHVVEPFEEPERPSTAYMSPSWVHQLTKIKLWSFTECNLLCYVDSDVVFYNDVMVRLAQECWSNLTKTPSTPKEPRAQLCAFEQSCENGDVAWNRKHWGMRYFQASIFCMIPDEKLYSQLLHEVVEPFDAFANGSRPMHGKFVYTEQVHVLSFSLQDRIS
jgi:hypothetical protein